MKNGMGKRLLKNRKREPSQPVAAVSDRVPTFDELDQSELKSIVGYALRRAQTLVYQDYARTVGELDIRPAQYAALCLILANPGLTQGTLSRAMGIDRSGAVSLIDALESRGLAVRVRSQADRRAYALMPTEAGQAAFVDLRRRVHDSDARVTAKLSGAERKTLISLLWRLYGGE